VKPYKFIISGGGTGGHIFPALAIADALKAEYPSANILFVGAKGRMEMSRVPQAGYAIKGLWIKGIQRKFTLDNILFPFKLVASLVKSWFIIQKFKPHLVVGTGGFASGPLLFMAAQKNIPILIQEQNAWPGITNRLLAKHANRICVAHSGMDKFFPAQKVKLTGNPLRESLIAPIVDIRQARSKLKQHQDRTTLLVLGGSLGARRINQLMAAHAQELIKHNVQILWQCGSLYEQEYISYGQDHIRVVSFLDDMASAYASADIILSRAGALAVSELCHVGKAVLFVPSPNVAEDHQYKNAMSIAQQDAAIVIKESELDDAFLPIITKLIESPSHQKQLGTNIKKLARPQATDDIVKQIKEMLHD
jgi:UDP-N-acetylglucosamine--N-acetylmuramyl-(pentapeptide) pyrophosphoryl-undecaprenol N-acetylglucosamine transferase